MNLEHYESRIGFRYRGSCWVGDTDYMYVTIPKNASSYTEDIWQLMVNNPKPDNFLDNPTIRDKKPIIILRDPLDRWMTGIVQNFFMQCPPDCGIRFEDETILKYIFQKLTFDEHSELQWRFLEGLDINNSVFIKFNSQFPDKLKDCVKNILGIKYSFWNKSVDQIRYNQSATNPIKQNNLKVLKDYYKHNAPAKDRLDKYLKPDYEFISNLTFYSDKSGI